MSCHTNEYISTASGRIIACDREHFLCALSTGMRHCRLTPALAAALQETPEWPTTGDLVIIEEAPPFRINAVLPRTGCLIRRTPSGAPQPLAANINLVLVLHSCETQPRPGRLLRLVDSVRTGGAEPLVLLTKSDLHPEPESLARFCRSTLPGTEVLITSAYTGAGMDELTCRLSGTAAVLLGLSGSGKSTLCNRLLGSAVQATAAVRTGDHRGRHTTVRRRLFFLPGGGSLIDTPGFREWRPWQGCPNPEIEALAAGCRFRNCTHTVEPGCAVLEAVRERMLPQTVYRHYLKLREEEAAEQRRSSEPERRNEERRWSGLRKEANSWRQHKRGDA